VAVFLDILFGAIGSAYLIYAKRQYSAIFLVAGFVLIIYPYFVSNAIVCALIGIVFAAVPFIAQKME
jgi:hypothetical protein